MGKKEKKRKTSFLRRLYEKITSAPTEPEDPGVDVSEAEEASEPGANDQGNEGTSAVKSVIFDQLIAQRKKQKSTILNLRKHSFILLIGNPIGIIQE